MNKFRSGLRALVCALVCASVPAWALDITYVATDLPDTVSGADRWRVDYSLSGDLAEFEGVNVLFAFDRYSDIQLAEAPDAAALSYYIEQPVAPLALDGLFVVTAVRPIVGESQAFAVSFDLLGGGTPAAQPFETFDANFTLTGTGVTVPVPEPASAVLLLAALAALALLKRRHPVPGG